MKLSNLKIKDEAFSKELFTLRKDKNDVLETYPKPKTLSKYYKFDEYISHQSSNRSLTNFIYNLVKRTMFKTKLNLIRKYKNELNTVLDYGCGTGDFVFYLKEKGIKAEGFEPTSIAYEKAKEKSLNVYNSLDKVSKTYDVITLFHVLEHVDDYNETIKKLVSKLNSNGLLIIAVPNYNSYDAIYYKEKWAAWDVPRHLWHFSKSDIKNIANQHNLELIKIKPLIFDAFYISMVSESYKGNLKIKGLWRGLISNLKALKSKEYSSNIFLLQKKTSNG